MLVIVTDGNDNASVASMDAIRAQAERTETVMYAVGLLNDEDFTKAKRAREELDRLTAMTGGVAYYPESVDAIADVALELARQIRCQYTIAYAPLNQALDGSYRKLRVVANGPGRLRVRTRAGYRATPRTGRS